MAKKKETKKKTESKKTEAKAEKPTTSTLRRTDLTL
jgi:hypothetical protein